MTKKAIIYGGCGGVGTYVTRVLVERGYSVTVADIDLAKLMKLQSEMNCIIEILLVPKYWLTDFLKGSSYDCDVAVVAVPGDFGYFYLKTLVEHCKVKNIVDVSFAPQDPYTLDELAKKFNKTVIVDCGIMPGLGDMLLGDAYRSLDKTNEMLVQVGGLMVDGSFKFVFCPENTLDEYMREAYIKENNELVKLPPLSRSHSVSFPGVKGGELVAFLTDGIRTSHKVFSDVPNLSEETMRFPSNFQEIETLKKLGFLNRELKFCFKPNYTINDFTFALALRNDNFDIELDEMGILSRLGLLDYKEVPLGLSGSFSVFDVVLKALSIVWKLKESDRDFTLMRVSVSGLKEQRAFRYVYELYIPYNEGMGISSMSWSTGASLVSAVEMLSLGLCKEIGIVAPGTMGMNIEYMEFFREDLKKQGISYEKVGEEI